MKKVALVLSGGAALGFAHIGIIKVLQQNNIPIDIITGSSMGSLIGGVYSAGVSIEEMEKIVENFSRKHIVDFNPFALADTGLLYGKKVKNLLKKIIGDKKIEDCKIKYAAIAADLYTGNKYVFTSGDLVTAIRSSISIPVIFKPVKYDHMCLIDGGACDNLPVEDARKMGADIVIAIDVCSEYQKPTKIKNLIDIIANSANALVFNFIEKQIDKGEIYIKIKQPGVSMDKFTPEEIKKSIDYGVKYAQKFLPQIKELLKENGVL